MITQSIQEFLNQSGKKFNQIERLIFIDIYLNYIGYISRSEIMREFDIAPAAASKDLNEYRELNESGTIIDHKEKVTKISSSFNPLFLISPIDALDMLTNGFNRNKFIYKERILDVEIVHAYQLKQTDENITRNITRALFNKKAIRCQYSSSNSNNTSERILFPTTLFVNNQDWYFRALERSSSSQFKNFKISRIKNAFYDPLLEPMEEETIEFDSDWNTFIPIEVKINSSLSEEMQRGIKNDFCLKDNKMEITKRAALFYFIKDNFKIATKNEIDNGQFAYFELLNQSDIKLILSLSKICRKNHRYADVLSTLPLSQNSEMGRHRCAGCAYEAGLRDGLNNKKHSLDDLDLPYSQAGTGRHRSAQAAYELGWKKGFKDFNNDN